MKQTISFKKDITFKTKIGEITAISLDDDLMLKGEDLISGNFYISGSYKMIETSAIEEDYSYKIPCEIAISDEYDTFDATIDIDDFHYEIIDDEVLRVNIVVAIDNLKKKEVEAKEKTDEEEIELLDDSRCIDDEDEKPTMLKNEIDNIEKIKKPEEFEPILKEDIKNPNETTSFLEVKESIKKQNDTYLTYKVYMFKEGDSIEKVLDKYSITKEDLGSYNDLDNISIGSKLVIPSTND